MVGSDPAPLPVTLPNTAGEQAQPFSAQPLLIVLVAATATAVALQRAGRCV
jgi:hypothetical protein